MAPSMLPQRALDTRGNDGLRARSFVVESKGLTAVNEHWPKAVEEGLIPTDNAMGIMTEELSPAAEAFIALAGKAHRPLLEIGAAYGNATLPALRAGGTLIANDLSASQLSVLAGAVSGEDRKRLVLMPARFPEEIRLGDGNLSGVLAAQVLHFFDGPMVELAFRSVLRWLEPGGALYALVMTPSLSFYSKLRPEYEKRAHAGERWPGIFDPRSVATEDWKERLPPMVHLFEKDVLRRCAEETGFIVETLEYFCFRHFPAKHRTDGHEYLTLTARKPAA
jgi:SAM-dependent methyltransferase